MMFEIGESEMEGMFNIHREVIRAKLGHVALLEDLGVGGNVLLNCAYSWLNLNLTVSLLVDLHKCGNESFGFLKYEFYCRPVSL